MHLLQVIPHGCLVETEPGCDVGLIHLAITFQELFGMPDNEADDLTLWRTQGQ